MGYRYRKWLSAFIVMIGLYLEYHYIVYPFQAKIEGLESARQQHQASLGLSHQTSDALSYEVNSLESDEHLLLNLTTAWQKAGLKLISVSPVSNKTLTPPIREMDHVVLQGSFAAWQSFIAAYREQRMLVVFDQLKMNILPDENLSIAMDVLLMENNVLIKESKRATSLTNPFCHAASIVDMTTPNKEVSLGSFSIKALKMLGYLSNQLHAVAWVLLPNGELVELKQGEWVGKESAVVHEITPSFISFLLKDQTTFKISLSNS